MCNGKHPVYTYIHWIFNGMFSSIHIAQTFPDIGAVIVISELILVCENILISNTLSSSLAGHLGAPSLPESTLTPSTQSAYGNCRLSENFSRGTLTSLDLLPGSMGGGEFNIFTVYLSSGNLLRDRELWSKQTELFWIQPLAECEGCADSRV